MRRRREGGETRSTCEGDEARQPVSQNQGEKSHEAIYERRRALHNKLSTRSRENKAKGRWKYTGRRQPEVFSGAARQGRANRRVPDAHHADRAVQDCTRARTGESSLPTQPRQGASPTLPGIIPRRADDLTRCRLRSPATDHQAGQQPPTPAPSAISSRKKKQVDGQATIPPSSYASVVAQRGNDKIEDVAMDGGWKLVQRRRYPTTERSPINPSMEGRCYRCLAWDQQAQTCREPVRCRLCRQNGHRQYACPRKMRKDARPEPPEQTPSGPDLDADCRMHPGNLSFSDPSGVLTSGVRAYTSTGPTKGDVAYDLGVDVPSLGRQMHLMATPVRQRQGISSLDRDLSARNIWRPFRASDPTALGGDARTLGDATEDRVYRAAIG